jgi:hypothetical protein
MKRETKIAGMFRFWDLPADMRRYIRHFGLHFNRKLYEFAVSKMERKIMGSERTEKMKPIDKSKFDEIMRNYQRGMKESAIGTEKRHKGIFTRKK